MIRCLQTTGQGYFEQVTYDLPSVGPTDIFVKAVMTGVCRSDIDMMQGNFGPLPLSMQGHEGLAQVISTGANVGMVQKALFLVNTGREKFCQAVL